MILDLLDQSYPQWRNKDIIELTKEQYKELVIQYAKKICEKQREYCSQFSEENDIRFCEEPYMY